MSMGVSLKGMNMSSVHIHLLNALSKTTATHTNNQPSQTTNQKHQNPQNKKHSQKREPQQPRPRQGMKNTASLNGARCWSCRLSN